MSDIQAHCPICTAATDSAGELQGKYFDTRFRFRSCPGCGYIFVENPSTDYAHIYDEKYYRGQGADPALDYFNELERPQNSVRVYEWRGILKAVGALTALKPDTRWLDFGCGNGGLVRYVGENSPCQTVGFEEGWITGRAREKNIPILTRDELDSRKGTFDVITAIEVVEHIPNPLECFKQIRALLKPGGLLFLTTGNAEPHRANFFKWGYVVPEIHVSFYEPRTLEKALALSGLRPEYRPSLDGFNDILRFKILKNLGVRSRSIFEKMLPWTMLSRAADKRYQISAHPIGWAV